MHPESLAVLNRTNYEYMMMMMMMMTLFVPSPCSNWLATYK
jgi:hypothetical protein